ncbi:MAG: mechanosensitive ion channel family protein [Actinomycetota bacterium]|jgi:moderate conductance mechanosensitive channel|nr:mechanosensitive ion channel family protein [Actinomycetota bacterium]
MVLNSMEANMGINIPTAALIGFQILLILILGLMVRFGINRSLRLFIKRVITLRTDGDGLGESPRRSLRADTLIQLAHSITSVVVLGIVLLLVLDRLGINLAPLLAGAGVAGIAIGFGAQALVKDLLVGISVLAEDQYGVGDVIDFGEGSGTVESMTLKTTRVRSLDGSLWHLPNGEIARVANKTQGWSRVILDIGVAYASEITFVQEKIQEVLDSLAATDGVGSKFLEAPEIWGVEDLAENSVVIRVVIKVLPGEHWQIARILRAAIKEKFDASNIEIPFPQVKIWQ